jgi:hypothetical protein
MESALKNNIAKHRLKEDLRLAFRKVADSQILEMLILIMMKAVRQTVESVVDGDETDV